MIKEDVARTIVWAWVIKQNNVALSKICIKRRRPSLAQVDYYEEMKCAKA